jgi:glycosyltransferase involved in cell wall biosynthesis
MDAPAARAAERAPSISIIVPCYNEQATIGMLLDSVYQQTYPCRDMEVIIADGMSSDGTRQEIRKFTQTHPELRVCIVDNPRKIIPAALNLAIAASSGDVIVRLDAHSAPQPDYVERCVRALSAGLGDNVGGIWQVKPGSAGWMAQAIAAAGVHPLAVGDARYRLGGAAQAVDTVPFGAFKRGLIDRVGKFDESLLSNEDYEFNVRIRQAGGVVWFDPHIQSAYYARSTLVELLRQYWRYGFWKGRMLRRYPETIRWRQFLPPVFVLSLLALAFAALWLPAARWLLAVELVVYLLVLLLAGIVEAWRRRNVALIIGLPLAIAGMHFSWGSALLWSMLR